MHRAALFFAAALLPSGLFPSWGLAEEVPRALAASAAALQPLPAVIEGVSGRTYAPAYSSVMAGGGTTRIDFSVTLSVHNGSAKGPLVIERIDYHDAAGRLVETMFDRSVAIRPYGTIQLTIPQSDTRGGLGADFVVDWIAPDRTDPIVETVMMSSHGSQSYALVSPGRRVER
jgi:hypothetical protein